MNSAQPIPADFAPSIFSLKVPFVEMIGPTYQRFVENGVDIGVWITEDRRNGGQMAHGGFLMSLGDIATGVAASAAMGENRYTVHVSFNMDFYAAAPLGAWVEAHARVERKGRSMVFCSCDYYANGQKIAHANATLKSSPLKNPATATCDG